MKSLALLLFGLKLSLTFYGQNVPDFYCTSSAYPGSTWNYLGPPASVGNSSTVWNFPTLGLISAVEIHPTNLNIMFAASNTAGLYKTIDGGQNWYSVTDQLNISGLGVNGIAIDQTDPMIMYAATGAVSNTYSGFSVGILKSVDGGETWAHTFPGSFGFANRYRDAPVVEVIRINPFDHNNIIAGGHKNIWVSFDQGSTWTEIFDPGTFQLSNIDDEQWWVGDIEFDPINPGVVYASTQDGRNDNSLNAPSYPHAVIFKSLDSGASWSLLWNAGDPSPLGNVDEVLLLDFTPADPGTLYAAYLHNTDFNTIQNDYTFKVSKSLDGGMTWTSVYSATSNSATMMLSKAEFEMSNLTVNSIYYAGLSSKRLFYDGTSWSNEDEGFQFHADIRDLKIYSVNPGMDYILAGNDGSIVQCEIDPFAHNAGNDNDMLWTSKNGTGLHVTQIYGLGAWERSNSAIYGTQDNGVWSIAGSSFVQASFLADGSFSSATDFYSGLGISGTQSHKKYTTNAGASWSQVPSSYDGSSPDSQHLRLRSYFSAKDNRKMLIGITGLATWTYDPNIQELSSNVNFYDFPGLHGTGTSRIRSVAVAPSDGLTMYVAFEGQYWNEWNSAEVTGNAEFVNANGDYINKVFKSTDGGVNFVDITDSFYIGTPGFDQHYPYSWDMINCITVDPRDANHLWVGLFEFDTWQQADMRVLESTDGGSSWEDMSSGLPHSGVHQILYQDGTDEIMYAATDAGVYRWNKMAEVWECFNQGLPPAIVTGLDIDYCTGTMIACTYGKGIWEVNLPTHDHNVVLTSSYTVGPYETHSYENDVIVESGSTLTVQGKLFFKEGKRIVVKTGGSLILDGGLLTNQCDGLWQGVEVWGNENLSQAPSSQQGYVELKNNAVIENAHTGIWVRRNDEDCNLVLGTGGGIVKVVDSKFLNNYIDVEFAPYIWFNAQGSPVSNKSYFRNSEFLTTRLLSGGFYPKTHLILNENYRIKVNGCKFENEAIDDPNDIDFTDYHNRGNGIVAHSATFMVDDYCTTTVPFGDPCPPGSTVHSTFSNLYHGVYESCADFFSTFAVRNSEFSNNFCGIRAEGMAVGPSILSNTFYINSIDDNVDAEEPLGVDIDNTVNFEIEENHFIGGSYNADPPLIGIAFTNTAFNCLGQSFKPSTQTLYRNWFDNLRRGIHVQGDNDGINPFSQDQYGLEFRCNKFGQTGPVNNADIFLNASTTVQEIQGNYFQDTEAGNLFSDNYSLNVMGHWDIGSGSTIIDKYYHNADNSPSIAPFIAPYGYDMAELIPFGTNNNYNESGTCPVLISTDQTHTGSNSQYVVAKSTYDDVYDIYTDNVDQGNTQALITFIQNSNNASLDVRNELIACSPYVSDNAWRSAFLRSPAMNPWHLAQALLHNSPLKQTVIQMMYHYNFDEYYTELVQNGQGGGVTDKSLLEADLVRYNSLMLAAENDYVRGYLIWEDDDEVNRISPIESHFGASYVGTDKYIKAGIKIKRGEYSAASTILGTCMQNGELDGYCRILSILNAAEQLGDCPKFSTSQFNELEAIAADENNSGHAQARALLFQELGEEFAINIWDDAPGLRKLASNSEKLEHHILRLSPNPAKESTIMSFRVEEGASLITIEIYDSSGRAILTKDVTAMKGIFEWEFGQLSSGLYIIKLAFDSIVVDTQTLIIHR